MAKRYTARRYMAKRYMAKRYTAKRYTDAFSEFSVMLYDIDSMMHKNRQ